MLLVSYNDVQKELTFEMPSFDKPIPVSSRPAVPLAFTTSPFCAPRFIFTFSGELGELDRLTHIPSNLFLVFLYCRCWKKSPMCLGFLRLGRTLHLHKT